MRITLGRRVVAQMLIMSAESSRKAYEAFKEPRRHVQKENDINTIREALEECGAAKVWKAESFLPRKKSFLEKMVDFLADKDS